jgi:hypothetical protein
MVNYDFHEVIDALKAWYKLPIDVKIFVSCRNRTGPLRNSCAIRSTLKTSIKFVVELV